MLINAAYFRRLVRYIIIIAYYICSSSHQIIQLRTLWNAPVLKPVLLYPGAYLVKR